MTGLRYLDFELDIAAGAGGQYPVRVLGSPAGQARGTLVLPAAARDQPAPEDEPRQAQALGEALFDALFAGEVRAAYDASRQVASGSDRGLRIVLRINAAELAAAPWELLRDARHHEFLALSRWTPVVRYLEAPRGQPEDGFGSPVRILALAASPRDLPPVDVAQEQARIEQAMAGLAKAGQIELSWVAGSTWRDLQAALQRGPWHVFHFVGHAMFDMYSGEGMLVLADEAGRAATLGAHELAGLLGDEPALRLAVLNACASAASSEREPFAGAATALVRRGTPSVLAMRSAISDAAAVEFTGSFYAALAAGLPVEAGVAEARKAIHLAAPGSVEWATPVLFTRMRSGGLVGPPSDLRAGSEPMVFVPARIELPGLRYYFDRFFPRLHWTLTRTGILSMPGDWTEFNDYLRALSAHIKSKFRAYLPLSGKIVPPLSPVMREIEKDPFVSPIHQVILQIMGRSYGGDSASAQIAVASRQSRVVHNILAHLDRTPVPLILLGEPGSGKTMTLERTAMMLAERESRRVFPRVPIYLRLGDFYVEHTVSPDDVWEYVQRSVPHPMRSRMAELEWSGRLVIFFDGMDEMSRERYIEHTEALSEFAHRTMAKTLFSCRITDFSPRFDHQQLVILPFNRDQVTQYLRVYVQNFPILIDGQSWPLKHLARHIMRGELPVEANNPFVLWLLCLYLQDKGVWPASRVAMLQYYNEQSYLRKSQEKPEDEPSFPDMQHAFREWARFAFVTTVLNRGGVVPVAVLQEGHDATGVQEMIRVGKRCGVLAESHERSEEHLVRFEHHRFQEFFAARHIHDVKPQVDWLSMLDAPRWQATMLNLILMGGAEPLVRTFSESITALTQACRTAMARKEASSAGPGAAGKEKAKSPEKASPQDTGGRGEEPGTQPLAEQEAVLADRVEVASRIMRETVVSSAHVRETLMTPFREAVSVLAEQGNPISQVKMMRACQNVPEIDFIEALRKPLNSPVNWVRNQALILLGGSRAGERAVGTDIATEIGYDLATGRFPRRFPAYWKAVSASGDAGQRWALLVGSFGYLVYLGWLAVAAALLYFGLRALGDATWLGLPDFSILGQRASMVVFGLGVAIAIAVALKTDPSLLWLVVLSSAIGLLLLMPVLYALWYGSWLELGLLALGVIGFGFNFIYGIGLLIAAPVQFSVLGLYLALTARVRRHGHALKTFVVGGWKSGLHNGKWLLQGLAFACCWLLGLWSSSAFWPGQHPLFSVALVATLAGTVLLPIYLIGYVLVTLAGVRAKMGWARFFRVALPTGFIVLGGLALFSRLFQSWFMALVLAVLLAAAVGAVLYVWTGRGLAFLLREIGDFAAAVFGKVKNLRGTLGDVLAALWAETRLAPAVKRIGTVLLTAAGIGLVYFSGLLVNGLWFWQVSPLLTGILPAAALGGVGFMIARGIRGSRAQRAPGPIIRSLLLVALIVGSLVGVYYLARLTPILWTRWRPAVAQICGASILLSVVLLALLILRPWAVIPRIMPGGARRFPPGAFTPAAWQQKIAKTDAAGQEDLLLRTDPQSLSLTSDQFLDVLREIEPVIKREPAQSTYWEQRDRLEEALRQERRG